jgi:outer membrane protein TolC
MRRAGHGRLSGRCARAIVAASRGRHDASRRHDSTLRSLAVGAILAAAGGMLVVGSARARDLTFPDALALLQERNEALKAADEEVQRAVGEKAAARGLLLPKVEASARFTRIDDPLALGLDLDLNGIRQVILGLHPEVPPEAIPSFAKRVDYQIQDDRFWRAGVNLAWPIYAGGRIAAARAAAATQVELARDVRRRTDEGLLTCLARCYFGVRLARQAVDVRQQVLDGLDRHLFEARRLEEEGIIARVERLHAEVARAEAAREAMKARRDLEVAQAALSGLLSDSGEIAPASPLFLQGEVAPLDSFLVLADRGNADLAALGEQQDLARQALRAQRGTLLPEVGIFGMKELCTGDLTALDPRWAVGIGARVTLFDGFANWNRAQAARSTVRRVDYLEVRARRDVATLVRKRHADLLAARDLFQSLDSTLVLAEENLRARTASFQEGLATSLEVVDARLTLSRVQLARLLAAYDFDVALAELLEACGQSGRFESYRASATVELQT